MAMIDNLEMSKQSNIRRLSICNSLSKIGLGAAFAVVFLAVIAAVLRSKTVCKVDLASYGVDDSTQCAHVRTSGGSSEEVLVRDESSNHRSLQLGVTIFELDPKTCTTGNRQSFMTFGSYYAKDLLLASLELKKEGTIIVGITVDTPEEADNTALKNVVGSFFSAYNMNLREVKFRGKFAFIMQKGYPAKTIFRSKPRYGECLRMKLELRGSEDEDVSFRLITWS